MDIQKDDRAPKRLRMQGNDRDVFVMVKQLMSSTNLSQLPLLVYPQAFLDSTEEFWNKVNSTNLIIQQSLDDERANQLSEFADRIEQDFPHMHRAVKYYRSLLRSDRFRQPYSQLGFVQAGPGALDHRSNLRLGEMPARRKPHHLQVVFHQ